MMKNKNFLISWIGKTIYYNDYAWLIVGRNKEKIVLYDIEKRDRSGSFYEEETIKNIINDYTMDKENLIPFNL